MLSCGHFTVGGMRHLIMERSGGEEWRGGLDHTHQPSHSWSGPGVPQPSERPSYVPRRRCLTSWPSPSLHSPLTRFGRMAALTDLFTRFIASANFKAWMALRQAPLVHLMAPEPLPVGPLLGHRGKPLEEVELIGAFFETEVELQVQGMEGGGG